MGRERRADSSPEQKVRQRYARIMAENFTAMLCGAPADAAENKKRVRTWAEDLRRLLAEQQEALADARVATDAQETEGAEPARVRPAAVQSSDGPSSDAPRASPSDGSRERVAARRQRAGRRKRSGSRESAQTPRPTAARSSESDASLAKATPCEPLASVAPPSARTAQSERLDRVCYAAASPLRRQILDILLASGPQSLVVLSRATHRPRQTLVQHLNVLEQAGLIRTLRFGRQRYSFLAREPLAELQNRWLKKYTTRRSESPLLEELMPGSRSY